MLSAIILPSKLSVLSVVIELGGIFTKGQQKMANVSRYIVGWCSILDNVDE
jgi:hypothetical protein